MALMQKISAATTVAQFVGVADNAEISKLIIDGAADNYKAFYDAIDDDKTLVKKLEEIQAANGNMLEPEMAINAISTHLETLKKGLPKATTGKSTVVIDDSTYKFAGDVSNPPIVNEKNFVITAIRSWGDVKTARNENGRMYKSITVDGYYLLQTEKGAEIVSGQLISNTSLFGTFVKFNIQNDEEFDMTGKELVYSVKTEEQILGVTTYQETREDALMLARKAGMKIFVNPTTGLTYVNCYHRTNNKTVFKALGARVNKQLAATLEKSALNLVEAKAKAQADAYAKEMESTMKIQQGRAETENLNLKVSGLLDTLANNSEKLQALNIDAQALMIAALSGK